MTTRAKTPYLPFNLGQLIALLADYELALLGSPNQQKTFMALSEGFPQIDFPSRAEPRSVVRKQLVANSARDPERFQREIAAPLTSPSYSAQQVSVFLSILEEAEFELPVSVIVKLADQLPRFRDDFWVDQIVTDLVATLERRETADLFALLHRISRHRHIRAAAFSSALHTVACSNASSLGELFRLFRDWIEAPLMDPQALAIWLSECARTTGPIPLLMGLATRQPEANGRLFLASFGFERSPFDLLQVSADEPDTQYVKLFWEGDAISLDGVLPLKQQQDWLTRIGAAMRNKTRDLGHAAKKTNAAENGLNLAPRQLGRIAPDVMASKAQGVRSPVLDKLLEMMRQPSLATA